MNNRIAGTFEERVAALHDSLRVDQSFDLLERRITVAGHKAQLFFVDAFIKDEILEKMLEFFLKLGPDDLRQGCSTDEFAAVALPYMKFSRETDVDNVVVAVLSGTTAMVIDGFSDVFMIDARTYPVRSIDEPQDDRVLRGSHDGFVETLVFNAALIRRRIRDPRLTFEICKIGKKSSTDVVICYMDGLCHPDHLNVIRRKLQSITIPALSMGQESLEECLCRRQRYNPFPKVRYTERPDSAAASVMEGHILLLVDNAPSAMVLPTSLFSFMQDTNDYYFPPLIGSYLRLLRTAVWALSLFWTPFWFLLMQNQWDVPPSMEFLVVDEPNKVPIIVQLLIIELLIDVIKLASLNTPNTLSNAFSVVGALILGEFAVEADLFVSEVLLYMAFVAVAAFTQSSYEMGYAFKLFRMLFLILTALWNVAGFVVGVGILILTVATTKTPLGRTYLYPLIPWNKEALKRLLVRQPLSRYNS